MMNPWESYDKYGGGLGSISRNTNNGYRVNLGGLKDFVQRHEMEKEEGLFTEVDHYSSVQLVELLSALKESKEKLFNKTRELAMVEKQVDVAGIILPEQLMYRIEIIKNLHQHVGTFISLKNVLLRILRKNVASEYLEMKIEFQHDFIDLFKAIGEEIIQEKSITEIIEQIENGNQKEEEFSKHQVEYKQVVQDLKSIVAKYQTLYDQVGDVRKAYDKLLTME